MGATQRLAGLFVVALVCGVSGVMIFGRDVVLGVGSESTKPVDTTVDDRLRAIAAQNVQLQRELEEAIRQRDSLLRQRQRDSNQGGAEQQAGTPSPVTIAASGSPNVVGGSDQPDAVPLTISGGETPAEDKPTSLGDASFVSTTTVVPPSSEYATTSVAVEPSSTEVLSSTTGATTSTAASVKTSWSPAMAENVAFIAKLRAAHPQVRTTTLLPDMC
jgi:hypothetical protein